MTQIKKGNYFQKNQRRKTTYVYCPSCHMTNKNMKGATFKTTSRQSIFHAMRELVFFFILVSFHLRWIIQTTVYTSV